MKPIILIVLVVISSFVANAQNLSFGPTAGFGHSWTNADIGNADNAFHPNYNIGGKMVYSFVTSWGISGDIKFSSEGQTIKTSTGNKISARANYIRIPLQGIYFFGEYGDRVRPKISIGPSFGFLVGGETDNGLNDEKTKTKEVWNNFDFGFTAAGGANIRVARATWLNLDLAYYHGITNVAKVGDAKNRNIGLNVGITFPVATVLPDK
jgi:hypothetical protein